MPPSETWSAVSIDAFLLGLLYSPFSYPPRHSAFSPELSTAVSKIFYPLTWSAGVGVEPPSPAWKKHKGCFTPVLPLIYVKSRSGRDNAFMSHSSGFKNPSGINGLKSALTYTRLPAARIKSTAAMPNDLQSVLLAA